MLSFLEWKRRQLQVTQIFQNEPVQNKSSRTNTFSFPVAHPWEADSPQSESHDTQMSLTQKVSGQYSNSLATLFGFD